MRAAEFEPMSVGQILDRTFSLYRQNFARFVTIVAVVTVPLFLIQSVLPLLIQGGGMPAEGPGAAFLVAGIVLALIGVLLGVVLQNLSSAALLKSISESYLGNEVTVGEAYRAVLPRLVSVIGAGILAGIIIMIGFLLLIVPGVIFMLWYALVTPVIVVEGLRAVPSLGRSKGLVSGNLGKVFGTLLVCWIIALIVSGMFQWAGAFVAGRVATSPAEMAAEQAAAGASTAYFVVRQLFSLAGSVLVTPIAATATILIYYDLRIRKEGFDLEMLARSLGSEGTALDAGQPTS